MIISASVGAGHDGAADALRQRLAERGFRVDQRDFLDLMPAGSGRLTCGGYQRILTLTPALYQRIYARSERAERPGPLLRIVLRATERRMLRTPGVLPGDTAAVVATYPLAAHVLGQMRRGGRLGIPAITYLTDFSVHPLWVAPGIDLHLAAHEVPAGQARGHGAARVQAAGPLVHPRFRPADDEERAKARARFFLPEQGRLALVVAGSWGVGSVKQAAMEINRCGAATPVVVCGRNSALAARLRAAGLRYVFGWVEDMPGLMHAADVLVQNAGGLSSLEAFAAGLPVASYRPLPGHGRTNAAALHESGLAVLIRDERELGPALTELIDGPSGRRRRAAGLALFENGPAAADAIAELAVSGAAPPSPATARVRRRAPARARRLSAALAASIAALWLATDGTQPALAHDLRSAVHYLVDAPAPHRLTTPSPLPGRQP